LVDHGSRRAEASAFLDELAALVRTRVPEDVSVHVAHMEIALPSVAAGMRACVEDGAAEIVVVPCFFAPGRHAAEDLPRLVAEAATDDLTITIAEPLGAHPLLAELVVLRAGVDQWTK
jgi:sirohydrochlorin ferrochelatase